MPIVGILATEPLQCSQVIGIPDRTPQGFENLPIPAGAPFSYLTRETLSDIACDTVVIEKRVIHVEKNHQLGPASLF
jgi:hypothetical protein